ncbi:MAG: hypothetical protein MJK07_16375 [Flavobacteriales bacterium]|nr:hypothetical protein [Flavobacteriales bacterium]
MRNSIILFVVGLLLIGCNESETNSNLVKKEKIIQVIDLSQVDSNRIVLLELDSTYLKRKDRSNANLKIDEYSQIQSLIENRLEEYNQEEEARYSKLQIEHPNDKFRKQDFVINLFDYARQYVAYFNKQGEKIVWINCFCVAYNNEWKEAVFIASDGGNCFFNLTVNLTTNKIINLSVNGNA